MAKVQWQFSASLDGFMAGPGGDMSWLAEHLGPNPTIDEIMGRTGALLVGNNTFGGDDPYKDTEHEGEPYGGGWSGPQFVLTHNPPAHSSPGTTFVTDLETAVEKAKAAAGGDDKYVGVLGASVGTQLVEAGLMDEILITVCPVMLGDGIPMFHHKGGTNVKLEQLSVTEVPGATNLWMRVVK